VRVEEYVGQRIRDRREELGMSQAEFGRSVGDVLGKPWPRQAVSAAELGKRSLGVTEIVVIANVLQTRPGRLLMPPVGVAELEMPGGAKLPAHAWGPDVGINDRFLSQMYDEAAHVDSTTSQATKGAKVLMDMLTTLIAANEVATIELGESEHER
jgi:transcriptional regulator with XRE-family HTH domain